MSDEQRRQDLADFLRTRRTHLSPEQAGIIGGGRRRTPGLRREEVAQLAHVGVSWYTLLEQGRALHPSSEVLQSIAEALHLTPDERRYLFALADQPLPGETRVSPEEVSPALRRIVDALSPMPAYIIGRRWNFLAWNTTAEQVLSISQSVPPYKQNAIWQIFANPQIHQIYSSQWEQVAQKVLAEFRAESVHDVDEAWLKRLVADLQRVSPEFRAWWPRYEVGGRADARKDIEHPMVGDLMFEHTTLQVPARPELKLMVYTPLPNTETPEKLQYLLDQAEAIPALR
jgi:transcriptional regulator with XRE-family HTH domain